MTISKSNRELGKPPDLISLSKVCFLIVGLWAALGSASPAGNAFRSAVLKSKSAAQKSLSFYRSSPLLKGSTIALGEGLAGIWLGLDEVLAARGGVPKTLLSQRPNFVKWAVVSDGNIVRAFDIFSANGSWDSRATANSSVLKLVLKEKGSLEKAYDLKGPFYLVAIPGLNLFFLAADDLPDVIVPVMDFPLLGVKAGELLDPIALFPAVYRKAKEIRNSPPVGD